MRHVQGQSSQQGGTITGKRSAARLHRFVVSWLSCRSRH